MAYPAPQRPQWLPPWLWTLIGGDDPQSQVFNAVQPLEAIPVALVRAFGPAGRQVIEYSAEDLVPRIAAQLAGYPEAQEIGRRAVASGGLRRLAEFEQPWLDEAMALLERGDPEVWGLLRDPELNQSAAVFIHPNRAILMGQTVIDPTALKRGELRYVPAPNLPQTLAHELVHAAAYGLRKQGEALPSGPLTRLTDLYRWSGGFGRYPAMQGGEEGEVLAETLSRALTGRSYQTARDWEAFRPSVDSYLQLLLDALAPGTKLPGARTP